MADMLLQLASVLSAGARELLLRDGSELELENARTRAFIGKFRLPNPLRVLHASAYEMVRTSEGPSDRRLLPADRAVLEELRFTFGGAFKSAGSQLERWLAPDGCIYLECSSGRRFLAVSFDDDHRISMWPDIQEEHRELFTDTDFMIASPDLLDDYRRILERTAEYLERTSARPLYRYADRDLDLDCVEFYLMHQAPMAFVKFAASQRAWTTVGELLPEVADGVMSADEARSFVIKFSGRMVDDGVLPQCRSCKAEVAVAFAEVDRLATCDGCGKPLAATSSVYRVQDQAALNRLLEVAPTPVVLAFWAPTIWSSALGAGNLHDAAIRNDASFIGLLVDVHALGDVARRFGISKTPTFLRLRDGQETGRLVGPQTLDDILEFGTAGG